VLVDFHSHTLESDGSLEPEALALAMSSRGVGTFSVTDHDSLAAYPRVVEAAAGTVVTGIEINSTYRGSEVHVLGYGMRLDDPSLGAMIERNRHARGERVAKMVAQLNRVGIDLTIDDVRAEAAAGAPLGRPHVAKALVRNAYAASVEAAFRGLLARDRAGYVPSIHVRPQDAIAAIAGAGGIPVLAHPGRLRDYDLIDELADEGLVGLEVFYPAHGPGQVQHFRERARNLGLVMTAGSDFHDARYGAGVVGVEVDPDDIAPFLELVAG
jgi:predicted metal-dependent phosphoesterase TrpH